MQTVILCFTNNGASLAGKLVRLLEKAGHTCYWHIKSAYSSAAIQEDHPAHQKGLKTVEGTLASWTQNAFAEHDAIIFIGAAGIAVRAIAPYVMDKYHDPAVLVIDEAGKFVIPLLSGHIGGANALAVKIADMIGAQAVVTTASEVQGKFAADVFAKKNGLLITNHMKAKELATRIVGGEAVPLYVDPMISYVPDNDAKGKPLDVSAWLPDPLTVLDVAFGSKLAVDYHTMTGCDDALLLVPEKMIWIGIGCKRGTDAEKIHEALSDFMTKTRLHPAAIAGMASVDIKADEAGILEACGSRDWPLQTYSADALMKVTGNFSSSNFVYEQTGVDCVCERAACLAASRDAAGLVVKKQTYEGITLAAAATERSLEFDR